MIGSRRTLLTAFAGLAAVAATGLTVYGASLAITFYGGLWKAPQPRTVPATNKA